MLVVRYPGSFFQLEISHLIVLIVERAQQFMNIVMSINQTKIQHANFTLNFTINDTQNIFFVEFVYPFNFVVVVLLVIVST